MNRYKVVSPLFNFEIINMVRSPEGAPESHATKRLKEQEEQLVKGVDLLEGVKIRYITKADHEDFRNFGFFILPHTTFAKVTFVIANDDASGAQSHYQVHEIIRKIVLALRLFKGDYVSADPFLSLLLNGERRLVGMSWDGGPKPGALGRKYSLTFDEIPELKKIVEKLLSIDFAKRRSLNLACKRFQRAYEEIDPEDQLIDLLIAFEALFLRGEKAGVSSGLIVATCCSALLGGSDEEREEISSLLSKAYSIRNSIVHGSEYQKPIVYKEYDLIKFVSRINEYLSEAIIRYLD
jgi:hypothetical protein